LADLDVGARLADQGRDRGQVPALETPLALSSWLVNNPRGSVKR
jgi:hypothetical protein